MTMHIFISLVQGHLLTKQNMLGGLFKVSAARSVPARSLAENVQKLPSTDSVRRVRLPALNITIDNIPGKKASVAIYSFLAAKHGIIDKQAAAEGLRLYDEKVAEAEAQPGAHPNIDLLQQIVKEDLPGLEVLVDMD
uniref:Uncharacterized protein n=1 Tax=Dunaliella tertiolecta TaxID=3047 RepID=A0A7S3VIB2_DUNTE